MLVSFLFKNYHNYFSAHTYLSISGKAVIQYASYLLIFSPLHYIIYGEYHEKYLYNQPSHYGNYGML